MSLKEKGLFPMKKEAFLVFISEKILVAEVVADPIRQESR